MISFEDFKKTELRTAKVLSAEEIPGADRLWKLSIEVGPETRQIVAGIKAYYTKESLVGKTIVIVNNLEPAVIRGVESKGMLLAAKGPEGLSLLTLDGSLPSGSVIG